MKLIVGLGNPEEKYRDTRHNVGFRILSAYGEDCGLSFQFKDKFKARLAELNVDGEKIILAKPTTYYNLSGEAVRALSDFYKIEPRDILIVHDELAQPFGKIRTRLGGSDAGNNGIKSVTAHIGPDTARLRFGIANELRTKLNDADFVLGNFSAEEKESMPTLIKKSTAIIDSFISNDFQSTTHS